MIDALTELNRFLDRRAAPFVDAMRAILDAMADRDPRARDRAEGALAEVIRRAIIVAELSGRRRMILEAKAARRAGTFTAAPSSAAEDPLTFIEAVEDIVGREPRVVPADIPPEMRSAWISNLYSREKAFAAARSASEKLTERVQKAVSELVTSGRAAMLTETEIMRIAAEEAHDWSRAYAATVYRTNISQAYNNGRIEQAKDPDVREVIPALEYVGIDDAATRPNHRAAFGTIAAPDDPIWRRLKPPLSWNCRCGLDFVSRFTLERRGITRLPRYSALIRMAGPDPGFRVGYF